AEAQIAELRKGQEVIFDKLDSQSGKLDTLTAALTDMRATTGPPVTTMVDMGLKAAGLFAAIVAGILYLATVTAASGLHQQALAGMSKRHALELRLLRIETALSMAAMRQPSPSAWMPRAGH